MFTNFLYSDCLTTFELSLTYIVLLLQVFEGVRQLPEAPIRAREGREAQELEEGQVELRLPVLLQQVKQSECWKAGTGVKINLTQKMTKINVKLDVRLIIKPG